MATNKPKIVIYSDQETISILDKIAKENNRSRGNMAETILKEYINNYNATHPKLESLNLENNTKQKRA